MTPTALFPFTDSTPLKNLSGGSAAKTFLAQQKTGQLFVRKWASESAAQRLELQARWVDEHRQEFLCPRINDAQWVDDSLFYYDMEYIASSCTLSQSLTAENGADTSGQDCLNLLLECVRSLNQKASAYSQQPDPEQRSRYLHEKFYRNIGLLVAGHSDIALLAERSSLRIHGKELRGLKELWQNRRIRTVMDEMKQENLFSFGHGDLTLSNLLLANNSVYVIDPNPNFGLISPAQELSKVLQSTLVSYESLNKIRNVSVQNENIEYQCASCDLLRDFTSRLLSSAEFRDHNRDLLLFHLSIHLCRIFPYLPEDTPERRIVYFAEVIKLLNLIADT